MHAFLIPHEEKDTKRAQREIKAVFTILILYLWHEYLMFRYLICDKYEF